VKAGQKGSKANGYEQTSQPLTLQEQLEKAMYERSAPGMVLNGTYAPKDKEGNTFPPGRGPVPPGSEDNFDPNIKLEEDGTIRYKTEEEKRRTKQLTTAKEGPNAPPLKIYTDGSSLSNGQAGAQAGVGVYFGPGDPKYASSLFPSSSPPHTQTVYTIDWSERQRETLSESPPRKKPWLTTRHPRNVSEALKGNRQTNQRAELTAISRALDIAPMHRHVQIYTDSKYAIDCVTNWYVKWQQNGWVNAKGKPVENKDLISDIRKTIEEREMLGVTTGFVWVKGHAGDAGNTAADRLAVEGAHMGRGIDSDVEREKSEDMMSIENGTERTGTRSVSVVDEIEDQEAEEAFEAMKRDMENGDDEDDELRS
jgi:ribonuclease HI